MDSEQIRTKSETVVFCGSNRFIDDMIVLDTLLTWKGYLVFAPTKCNLKAPNPLWNDPKDLEAGSARLANVHYTALWKADWVLVVGDYIGESVRKEIAYSKRIGLTVKFTDPKLAYEFGDEVFEWNHLNS